MDHHTLTTYSLLVALGAVTAYAMRDKWVQRVLVRPCGGCDESAYHTHHLTAFGRWHYAGRYKLYDVLFGDRRPQPEPGGDWYGEYAKDWYAQFESTSNRSCWVRDERGYWVWCTDTPIFDRDWFDEQGWQFPAKWITYGSLDFYTAGHDGISTVVSLETQKDSR
jgi:hypothetical protein